MFAHCKSRSPRCKHRPGACPNRISPRDLLSGTDFVRAQRGFSIVELFIAVAIILVICAIAVPGLLHSRVVANESLAVASMREIDTAESAYANTYGNGFANSLTQLGPPTSSNAKVSLNAAGLLDSQLGCSHQPCLRAGYGFAIIGTTVKPIQTYRSLGMPIHPGITGGRGYCNDQTHRLFADPDGNANCNQPVR
ncbi:hypothetical protein Acid345_4141 [Candidatus Koribacter versatilis Ellin345]|uniref:Prepilin-type N-terminal cleavage/methylation domain-containing protein n=1 Tax=Koribacter versatilis (strain Ellin345) TaxID=204669 RepID=Q1IJ09_KORVE|nr:hypothetical protein Acid345_4141 [Candidatus Koribacter versatilis Ellin345]